VVRIVKKEAVRMVTPPVLPDASHQMGRIPLMNDYDVGAAQRIVEIQSLRAVENASQVRICSTKFVNCATTLLSNKILAAPTVLRFKDPYLMIARY
jgi:hypothetical protein